MKYLEEYDFVMINILNFIKNNHRDFTIDKPIVVTKKKHINKITKKWTENNIDEKNAQVSKHKQRKENDIQYLFTY